MTEGWSYTDDSWQNAGVLALTEAEVGAIGDKNLPGLALRRVTRRRRWWRRVYQVDGDGHNA